MAEASVVCRLLALMSLTLLPLLWGCESSEAAAQPAPPPPMVTVANPLVRQVVEWDRYIGRTQPVEEVDIRSRVSGYLKSIEFTDGELVDEGDLLFVIDPRPFESALDRAEAAVLQAKADLMRTEAAVEQAESQRTQSQAAYDLARSRQLRGEKLADLNAMPDEELDQRRSLTDQAAADAKAAEATVELAKAEVNVAKAAVVSAESERRTAEIQLGYTQIVAPISGRISRHLVSVGNLIAGGEGSPTLLTTIVAVDPVHVYFDVNEREYLKYVRLDRSGDRQGSREAKNPVFISLADEEGFPHEGHMDFVDNVVDRDTGTMRGRAIFRNEDDTLTGGLFARVRIPGSAPYDAMLLPEKAVAVDQTQEIVYVLTDEPPSDAGSDGQGSDGKSEGAKSSAGTPKSGDGKSGDAKPTAYLDRRVVTTGPTAFGLKIIRSGLKPIDRVVIGGLIAARPGSKVRFETGEVVADEKNELPSSFKPWPKERWIRPGDDAAELPEKADDAPQASEAPTSD